MITGYITHDEAMVRDFIDNPAYADELLAAVISDVTGTVSHEEAVVRHFMEDPELGEIMLQDAIADGDIDEIRRVQRANKGSQIFVVLECNSCPCGGNSAGRL